MLFDWWTLTLQAVNVLILAWLLGRFFYRPVSAIITARQAEARRVLSTADAARASVEKAQADIAATRKGFAVEREKLLQDARKEADAARASVLQAARAEADALRAENQAHWIRERAAAEDTLVARAGTLAVDIARRLIERLPQDAAADLFVESICRQIGALPQKDRELLALAADRAIPVDVASAGPLNDVQRQRCADAIKTAAGMKVAVAFRTDPGLIAGIRILGGEIAIDDSWRNDLNHVLKDLTADATARSA
jgi:F-type H+-transporting ATPase subunit b